MPIVLPVGPSYCNQGLIISDMLQLFDWKLQISPILLSGAPLRVFYLKLRDEVYHQETSHGVIQISSEDRMIVVWVILLQYQRVTDRQTDGRTDLL